MGSDAGMIIGETHLVCQDYARTLDAPIPGMDYTTMGREEGPLPHEQWAFVSDGCSGSPDTDVGSRLLVLSAIESILQGVSPFEEHSTTTNPKAIALLASYSAKQLGLHPHAIDATLIAIRHDAEAKGFGFMMAGDGVIGLKQGEAIHLLEINYPSGCPYYLSYELDEHRKKEFNKHPAGIKRSSFKSKDGWESRGEETIKGGGVYASFWPANPGDIAFAITDGASSVMKSTTKETTKTKSSVKLIEVVDKLVAFKGTQGQFVSRRLRGFQKEAKAENWSNHDDIGLAAIAWENNDADHSG